MICKVVPLQWKFNSLLYIGPQSSTFILKRSQVKSRPGNSDPQCGVAISRIDT